MLDRNGARQTAHPVPKWFRLSDIDCHDVATLAARLAPFGVTLGERMDASCVVYRMSRAAGDLVKEVGEVYRFADRQVRVHARWDATDAEVVALLQAAELAVRLAPSRAAGWVQRRRQGRSWWQHTLLLPVGVSDPYRWAFRRGAVGAEPLPHVAVVFGTSLAVPVVATAIAKAMRRAAEN